MMEAKIRKAVWRKATDGRCWYCGCKLDPFEFHVDHFHPKSRGGSNDIENLVPSCISCNLKKHNSFIWEWRVNLAIRLGLNLSKHQIACINGEGTMDEVLANIHDWEKPVLFYFERNLAGSHLCRTYVRYSGWLNE